MINHERLCYAHTTDGQPCRATAIRGQLHCYAHGERGQRRAYALRRAALLRSRRIPVTIATLAKTIEKYGLTRFYPELMQANARLSAQ
ncbi:MAG TPA: hypothetical protein VHX60_14020 [Acidobacteriaceae bacterium]|nr:hypothetical protein [Acidobacteriaceae bacterium]